MANWEKFHKGIHQYGLYSQDDDSVQGIMDDMATEQIIDIGKIPNWNLLSLSLLRAITHALQLPSDTN